MKENQLEQQSKIDTVREKTKRDLGYVFDHPEELNSRIDNLILRLKSYEEGGLVFNGEKIIRGVKESVNIKDREAFVSHLMTVLEPLVVIRATSGIFFEDLNRRADLNDERNLKLSEVLYTQIDDADDEINIHLTAATELIKEEGIGNFKKEIKNGLIRLAEIIKSHPNINKIWATSWIVAKNPTLVERFGFTVVGGISEEEKREHFREEDRPVAQAFITREELLARYGTPEKM